MASVKQRALQGVQAGVSVVDVLVLDKETATRLRAMSASELEDEFSMKLPQIPAVVNEHTLMVALELCFHLERDLAVQRKLLEDRRMPTDRINRTSAKLAARIGELETMLKAEKAKKQWFRR